MHHHLLRSPDLRLSFGFVLLGFGSIAACSPSSTLESEYGRAILELAPATHNAAYVGSDLGLQLAPGEKRAVRVTMNNNGVASPTDDWVVGTHYLRSTNIPIASWGVTNMFPTVSTPVGGQQDVYFRVVVPAANPNASFQARMFANFPGSVDDGYFGETALVGGINIDPANPPMWGCAPVSNTLPASLQAGEARTVSIEVENTGFGTWTPGNFCLRSADTPSQLWGSNFCAGLNAPVPPGGTHTFTFSIVAPSNQTGPVTFQRQMFGLGLPSNPWGVGFFSDINRCLTATIDVVAGAAYDATVAFQDFPATMVAGQQVPVSVRMLNTGTQAWTANDFALYSTNTPVNLWGTVARYVTVNVPNGSEAILNFTIRAPAAVGNYSHRWRMTGFGTIGLFGEEINVPVTVLNNCGNGVIEPPEACDDGNLDNGDGCSAACQIEPSVIDTATDIVDRLFIGTGVDSLHVATDLTGDGIPDLILGQQFSLNANGTNRTAYAGAVVGYAGGAGFFGGGDTTLPTGAAFFISGAEREDFLGSNINGMMKSGPVYAGGNSLVVSAPGGDGDANGRLNAGEVYVFTAASLTGFLDLAANPGLPAATIIGPSAGSAIRVLDVRDANGDGLADVLIGAPLASPLGRAEAGEVYLLSGGPNLTGVIDLSTVTAPLLLARFIGQNAGDRLGETGALGNVVGDASVDLLLGAPNFSSIFVRAGAAYAVSGPLTGTYDMGGDYTRRWRGADVAAGLGAVVALANVRGTPALDVIITGTQYLSTSAGEPDSQRGGVAIVEGPITAGDALVGKGLAYAGISSMIFGEDFSDNMGTNLAIGNYNQDGYADMFVGAYAADGPGNTRASAGAQYLLIGRNALPAATDLGAGAQPDVLMHGPSTPALMGRFRSGAAMGNLDNAGGDDFCAASGNASLRVYCVRSTY